MINELFLWSINDNHYLLTPDKKIALTQAPIENLELTDGYPANRLLAKPLQEYLEKYLNQTDITIRLYLHHSLAHSWQALNWESLSINGKQLKGRLQLIRYADFEPAIDRTPQAKWLMLDHWENRHFSKTLQQTKSFDIKLPAKIDTCLNDSDISDYQGVLLIAHGSEQAEHSPLLKADGSNWQLTLPPTLPPIVLIIACASQHNNFNALINECLEKGSTTVIAPHGQLDAAAMQTFLTGYFKDPSQPISCYLFNQQQENPQAQGGANCLRLYGKLQPVASSILADYRQTHLDYYYRERNILNTLREQHSLEHEREAKQWLKNTLDILPTLPIATQVLLIDYCDYLAEQWATDKSREIATIRKKLEKSDCDYQVYENPFKIYIQAKAYRRAGKYIPACNACATLYVSLNKQKDNGLLADFYGLLVNILIDFNLPNSAAEISQLLDECINHDASELMHDREQKRYDRRARLYMRQAKYIPAIQQYQFKLNKVADPTNGRENTTLLYAQAWINPAQEEITNTITTVKQMISAAENTGFGASNYAIRTLALAAWRTKTQDTALITLLSGYADEITDELSRDKDKGPAGMTFFFAYLAGIDGYQEKDNFEKAIGALDDDQYWLELALLLSICGQTAKAQPYLSKYQKMRKDSLEKLNDFWQAKKIAITDECAQRATQECRLIKAFNESLMLDQGLIPL